MNATALPSIICMFQPTSTQAGLCGAKKKKKHMWEKTTLALCQQDQYVVTLQ